MGCVLLEMATARPAFDGPTPAVVFAAILHGQPTATTGNAELDRIIAKALEKDREERYQSARDMLVDLKRLRKGSSSHPSSVSASTVATVGPPRRSFVPRAAPVVGVICVAAVVLWLRQTPSSTLRVGRVMPLANSSASPGSPIVTDGLRLYFTRNDGHGMTVMQASTADQGEPVPLPTPFSNVALHDITRDHTRLLLGEFDGPGGDLRLWSLPLPGGSPQRIGSASSKGVAAWTPDGRGVVYSKGREAWQVNADGTAPHKLFLAPSRADFYRFSPDGTRLRFNVYLPGTTELWESRADGSDLHRVVSPGDPADDCCGTWTPDGRNYLFISARGFPARNVYGIWSQSEPRWYGGGRLTN